MKRLFSFTKITAALAAATVLFTAQPLRADDGGSWISLQLNKGWQNTYAFLRAEHRSFNDFSDTEAMFTALGFGYKFAPWFKADVSYEYWDINPDIKIQKGVLTGNATLARDGLAVSIREKLEYAPKSSTQLTLRSRLRGQYSIPGTSITPYAMAEVFNWDKWVRSLYYVGAEIKVWDHSMFDLYYLYHLPAGNQPVHLLGIGYYFNF